MQFFLHAHAFLLVVNFYEKFLYLVKIPFISGTTLLVYVFSAKEQKMEYKLGVIFFC